MPHSYILRGLLLLAQFGIVASSQEQFSIKNDAFLRKREYSGDTFLSAFTWETMSDPTHGAVDYVDQETALSNNLSFATADKFIMRVDPSEVMSDSQGRKSIRITSHEAFEDSLMILDLAHMPEGCATWPAWWTLSKTGPWPNGGELDIIEGVNLATDNLSSMHTTAGCTQPATGRDMMGSVSSTDCNAAVDNNKGCGVTITSKSGSYGVGFNMAGGGWYAVKRVADEGVSIWFWSRQDDNVPFGVRYPGDTAVIDGSWGTPDVRFVADDCYFSKYFDAHEIIFDITLCGDWADSVWSSSGCGSGSCPNFVAKNPQAFVNAYWDINSLNIYTPVL